MSDLLWQKPGVAVDEKIQAFLAGDDVVLDREFFLHDIAASRGHAQGLQSIGLLSGDELVSHERELFSGAVDKVDAPGTEGDFGVLADHAPFMTTLKVGQVKVYNGGAVKVFEIEGGFADVTPEGLTILAEQATEVAA